MSARTFAIGDIHGCSRALDAVLSSIAPTSHDLLVFLGDYVDRGPNSAGVIERLIELERSHRTIFIRGNHEEMMLRGRSEPNVFIAFCRYGGHQTLASYGGEWSGGMACVPDAHFHFLECTEPYHELPEHILVHAPLLSRLPLLQQEPEQFRWGFDIPREPHCSGKTVVCGHLTQRDGVPMVTSGTYFIDTWAFGGEWLTALCLETGQALQGNQRGERRTLDSDAFTRGMPGK